MDELCSQVTLESKSSMMLGLQKTWFELSFESAMRGTFPGLEFLCDGFFLEETTSMKKRNFNSGSFVSLHFFLLHLCFSFSFPVKLIRISFRSGEIGKVNISYKSASKQRRFLPRQGSGMPRKT